MSSKSGECLLQQLACRRRNLTPNCWLPGNAAAILGCPDLEIPASDGQRWKCSSRMDLLSPRWHQFIFVATNTVLLTLYLVIGTRMMMTSSNGNIFRVTGPWWGKSTSDRWIPLTRASDAELWSAQEQTVKKTTETQVILGRHHPIMTSLEGDAIWEVSGDDVHIQRYQSPYSGYWTGMNMINALQVPVIPELCNAGKLSFW